MTPAQAMTKPPAQFCEAETRKGGRCQRPAGWGTDHAGWGRCKLHLGSTLHGRQAAARQAGVALAGGMGIEVHPHEALLQVVYLTAGQVAQATRHVVDLGEQLGNEHGSARFWVLTQYNRQEALARYSKMALDAGVQERAINLAERLGSIIAAAGEDAIADVLGDDATPELRARFARAFATRLAVHEANAQEMPVAQVE